LTIGPRSLKAGGAELKHRDVDDTHIVPIDNVIATLTTEVERLLNASRARAIEVTFPE
jgi:hypothetical protein